MESVIDMLLFCPQCGEQHIDAPNEARNWTNPPHRSHECQTCFCIWRQCDQPTNGVKRLASGKGYALTARLNNGILQAWVTQLGLRHQGVLVSAIRGCDNVPREDASKHISRFYRACILRAHCVDPRKSASFLKWLDDREDFEHLCGDFFRSIDHYPNHFILHLAHAAQICGYYMPGEHAEWWLDFYYRVVKKFHMFPESKTELDIRLNADEKSFGEAQA